MAQFNGLIDLDKISVPENQLSNTDKLEQEFQSATVSADKTILYNSALNSAINTFDQEVNSRLAQQNDPNGAPRFHQFQYDLNQAANSTAEQIDKYIPKEISQEVNDSFYRYIEYQKPDLYATNRQQQLQYYNEQFYHDLAVFKEKQLNIDNINVDFYNSELSKMVDNGVRSGILTQDDGVQIYQQGLQDLTVGVLTNKLHKDPDAVIQDLSNPENYTNLPDNVRYKLIDRAKAFKQDQEYKNNSDSLQQQRVDVNKQTTQKSIIENKIQNGEITAEQLSLISQAITADDADDLKSMLDKTMKKAIQDEVEQLVISQAVDSGTGVIDVPKTSLSKNYTSQVTDIEKANGQPATLTQKAVLASKYKTDLDPFTRDLDAAITTNPQTNGSDLLKSYEYLRSSSPQSLEKLSKPAELTMAWAESLHEFGGMNQNDALTMARRLAVKETTPAEYQQRLADFNNISKFKDVNRLVNDKVIDGYKWQPKEILSLGLMSQTTSIAPEDTKRLNDLLREAYVETGDESTAVTLWRKRVSSSFAPTVFNNAGNSAGQAMFYPPERIWPSVKPSLLIEDFTEAVKTDLKMDPSKVVIKFDALSRGVYGQDGKEHVSYSLWTKDSTNATLPILNPATGQIRRWYPDVGTIEKGVQDYVQKQYRDGLSLGPVGRAMRESKKQIKDWLEN